MKKLLIWLTIFFCVFNIAMPFSIASNPLSGWKYYKSITSQGTNKYKAIYLDNEVYKYASSNLSDLRIVNDKNAFIPYYIQYGYSHQTKAQSLYDAEQIRRYKEKNHTIYDFKVVPDFSAQKDILGNSLIFNIHGEFLKKIHVYGSYDNLTWHNIVEDQIYMVQNMPKLDVPLNDDFKYNYYRVRILNDIENIELDGLKLKYSNTASFADSYSKNIKLEYDIKNQQNDTLITIKNPDKLKIKTIHLNIDGNFNREYKVFTKDGDTIIDTGIFGNLYSLNFKDLSATNTDVDLGASLISSDIIQLKIFNFDDPPADIKSLEAQYNIDKIIFEAKPDIPCRLFFSNSSAQKPAYDIESFKNHIELENQDVCTLSKISANPDLISDQAKTVKIPDLTPIFNVVIVVLSIGLIVLLAAKLKGGKNSPDA